MKKVFAFCLCLLPLISLSQKFKPLDSLTLIKFGAAKADVVNTIKKHGGIWEVQYSRPQLYVFSHLTFDSGSKLAVVVKFTSEKAYEVDYVIGPAAGVNVICYYCEIIQKISNVYGAPKSEKQFKFPCKPGDNNEIKAIKLGLDSYSSYWRAGKNSIIVSIDHESHIIIAIQDNKLTNEAFENQDGPG
jgi:hypothetical protein